MPILQKIDLPSGWVLHHFDTHESTNKAAREFYDTQDEALQSVHVFWADQQTEGRGRMGRRWFSPRGNLYVSFLLPQVNCDAFRLSECSFVMGVALVHTFEYFSAPHSNLFQLKWPNDVVCKGAKVAGILLESCAHMENKDTSTHWIIAGIGVNLSSFPENLPYPATSVEKALGKDIAPESFLIILAEKVKKAWTSWEENGFNDIRDVWIKKAASLGKIIKINNLNVDMEGIFDTIDDQGNLILLTENGKKKISSGDVFL